MLMVGERCGILRIYSIGRGCAKLALRSPPILYADWSLSDPSVIVACGPQGIFIWNIEDQL